MEYVNNENFDNAVKNISNKIEILTKELEEIQLEREKKQILETMSFEIFKDDLEFLEKVKKDYLLPMEAVMRFIISKFRKTYSGPQNNSKSLKGFDLLLKDLGLKDFKG